MPLKTWIKSANFAIEGILFAAKHQRHVRYHFYSAAGVLILSYILDLSKLEFLIIALAVIAVLFAELINTAIEAVVDILSPEHHYKAGIAKDVAAGAVLITAFGAALIGYIILLPHIYIFFNKGWHIARHTGEEIAMASFILVLIIVVITKAYFGKGTPLRGGMPSGHAAVSFSLWVIVTFLTDNTAASLLFLILAAAVSASRVITRIHSLGEVFLGGVMGTAITFLFFRLFS